MLQDKDKPEKQQNLHILYNFEALPSSLQALEVQESRRSTSEALNNQQQEIL